MAQFFTDFSEYADSTIPSDWTEHWNTTHGSPIIVSGFSGATGTGSKVLQVSKINNTRYAFTWDVVDGAEDVEIVARVQVDSNHTNPGFRLVGRVEGTAGDEYTYYIVLEDAFALGRYFEGSASTLDTGTEPAMAIDTWFRIRLQISDDDVRGRIWEDNEEEPSTWDVESLDDVLHGAQGRLLSGAAGIGMFISNQTATIDWIGIGTEGDSAPTETIGFTGTLTAILQEPTASLAGDMDYEGDIAATLQNAVATMLGAQEFTGTMASELQLLAATLSGLMIPSGTITSELQKATAQMIGGQSGISGLLQPTLQYPTAAFSGWFEVFGELVAELTNVLSTLSGYMNAEGTIDADLQAATFAATGASGITGVVVSTLIAVTMTVNGVMAPEGTLIGQLQRLAASASGIHSISAVLTAVITEALFSSTDAQQSHSATIAAIMQHPYWGVTIGLGGDLDPIEEGPTITTFTRRGDPRFIRPGIFKIKGSR